MKKYITIDGGTTNTRVRLVEMGKVEKTVKIPIGAKKSIDGNAPLKSALSDAIKTVLDGQKPETNGSLVIIASGMITSEFGLVNLPHLVAPVGINELAENIHTALIPEVSDVPINFIRGVKTVGDLYSTDMMRGEETELVGIQSKDFGECVYVLPGSHSKLIYTDADGRITRFSTTLTGELISAVANGTILKDAVSLDCEKLDTPHLEEGFLYAKERGINEALFKTRILKNLFGKAPEECYSFFLGAILADEINTIISSDASCVVIGGKKQIKAATAHLLERYSTKKVVALSDEQVDASTSLGMIRIYENK